MALDYKQLLREEKERIQREILANKAKELSTLDLIEKQQEDVLVPSTLSSNTSHIGETSNIIFQLKQIQFQDYRLTCPYTSIYYVPNILDESDARFFLERIDSSEEKWTSLRTRRLQLWGKRPDDHFQSSSSENNDQAIPNWLDRLIDQSVELGIFREEMRPNNVLINQYQQNQGILHHTDGPSYYNRVAIFSLESPCIMTFKPKLRPAEIGVLSDQDVLSVVLQPLSLLIFADDLYDHYMHGIYPDEDISIVGNKARCVNLELANVNDGDQVS